MDKMKERWKDIGKKIRLDRRVAVILACVAAAACILLVLQLYTMKQVTVLDLDAAALPGEEVLSSLREHTLEKTIRYGWNSSERARCCTAGGTAGSPERNAGFSTGTRRSM